MLAMDLEVLLRMEKRIVTTRWLAATYNLHIFKAQEYCCSIDNWVVLAIILSYRVMNEFWGNYGKKDLYATFLVQRTLPDGNLQIAILTASQLFLNLGGRATLFLCGACCDHLSCFTWDRCDILFLG